MHWFDRFSRQMAEPRGRVAATEAPPAPISPEGAGSTRRTVLRGATLAALALPFAPDAVGRAVAAGAVGAAGTATRERGVVQMPADYQPLESINEFCTHCMERSYGKHDFLWNKCGPSSNAKPFLKPKGGGGKGGGKGTKTTPSKAARQLACQAKVLKSLDKELQGCKLHFCEGDSEPPVPSPEGGGGNGATGTSSCPAGTSLCSQEMCCYGGDACCVCASTGGFICCAGVIGCACC